MSMQIDANYGMMRQQKGEVRELGMGLNAGFELDDDEDDEIDQGDDLDIEKEAEELVSLECRLIDLTNLAADIRKTHGMSQSYAMEAEKLLPGFGGVPMGYYSKDATATRFAVSLEELHKGIWALIAAGVIAVITLIVKIISWFKGDSGKDGKPGKGTPAEAIKAVETDVTAAVETPKNVEKAAETLKEINGVLKDCGLSLKDKNGKETTFTSFDQAITILLTDQERYSKTLNYLKSTDPLLHDIIHNGPYTKNIHNLSTCFNAVKSHLDSILDGISAVIAMDKNKTDTTASAVISGILSHFNKDITFKFDNKDLTLKDITSTIQSSRADALNKTNNAPMPFDTLYQSISDSFKRTGEVEILKGQIGCIGIVAQMEEKLKGYENRTRSLSEDSNDGANSSGIGAAIRETIVITGHQVVAFGNLSRQIREFTLDKKRIVNDVISVTKDVIKRLDTELTNSENKSRVPKQWKALKKQHEAELVNISNAFRGVVP